jgi:hypothetical protein
MMNKASQWVSENPLIFAVVVVLLIVVAVLSTGWGVTASMAKSKYDNYYYGSDLTSRYPGSVSANSAMTNPSSNYTGGNSLLVLQGNDTGAASACSADRRRPHRNGNNAKKSSMSDAELIVAATTLG